MKKMKRLLSIVMSMAMMMSLFGGQVYASTTDIEGLANLFVGADDYAEIYINGSNVANYNVEDVDYYTDVQESLVDYDGTPFIAVEAWDQTGSATISGFKLLLDTGEGYEATDSSWYYYVGGQGTDWENERPTVIPTPPGAGWMNSDYVAEELWQKVTTLTADSGWAADDEFPDETIGEWIWSPNYDQSASSIIDSPVYFRSSAPEYVDVNVVVVGGGIASVNDGSSVLVPKGTSLEFLWEEDPGYELGVWDVGEENLPGTALVSATYTVTFDKIEKPTPKPKPVKYTLTVEVVGDGDVPGFVGTNTFSKGTNVNLNAVIGDAIVTEFKDWSGDASGDDLSLVAVLNSDMTLVATFVDIVVIEVEDEATPEATPIEEPILDIEEDFPEEAIPQTGGLPMAALALFGTGFIGFGVKIRKRR